MNDRQQETKKQCLFGWAREILECVDLGCEGMVKTKTNWDWGEREVGKTLLLVTFLGIV